VKTTLANKPIEIWNRLSSAWNAVQAYQKSGNAEWVVKQHKKLCDTLEEFTGVAVHEARILDIGCGQMATQVALFTAAGAQITGVDTEAPSHEMNLNVFLTSLRQNGFKRAAKSVVRQALFDGTFNKNISLAYGKPVSFAGLDCRIMSVMNLQFPDEHFDFIFSDWVFEHIEDVARAVKEISRVLKKTGVARISIHLFPSLSGGHHPAWSDPDTAPSKEVPPWDHLLENNYPANIYLNKLTMGQYRQIFHNGTLVIREHTKQQGANVLNERLLEYLSAKGYTRKDLLTYAVTFVFRKK
jgi:SAM-dependent methyltransferase